MRFIKDKFFYIVMTVALVLVIVPTTLYSMGLGNFVREGVCTLLLPVQKLFSYAADGLGGFADYFTEYDRLKAENKELRDTLSNMRDELISAEELEQLNEWLFSYLELKREHTDYSFEPANVTGHGSENYITVFTLDRGESDGVRKDMAVVTPDGLVGHIVEAGDSWSKAVTLIESGSAIGAKIERSGETGLIEGDFSLAAEGKCKLTYLSADSDVKEGDRVMTTGSGSVYPEGLVIGYVSSVEPDALTRTKIAYITAAADIKSIDRLMVITDYSKVRE